MDKRGGNENPSAKMADSEEEASGKPNPREPRCQKSEGACHRRDEKDDEHRADVKRSIVEVIIRAISLAGRPFA